MSGPPMVVAPVEAPPKLESGEGPKRLGGVPTTLGGGGALGDKGLGGVPIALGVVSGAGLCGEPKMLGVVPSIGAAPVEGAPTLPMGLPGTLEIEGAAPTAGAPPGAAAPCPKVVTGSPNSVAANNTGTANVRCNIGVLLSCLQQVVQGPFRRLKEHCLATP
jgi:hypothetical protein